MTTNNKFFTINWISAIASFISVAIFCVLIMTFVLHTNDDYFKTAKFNYFLVFVFIFLFIFNYYALEFLFRYYSKKQIKRITNILPDNIVLDSETNIGFKELSERVHEMNLQNEEFGMLKEMENYRREYIGNVSHELKTPLFSIQGYIETLRNGGVDDLSIRDKYLQRIDNSVERLLNIVKDLDMINRFEAGQINLQISSFDINQLIQEIFDLLEIDVDRLSMKMKLQTTQKQLFVYADKQKISQVLINLISNSIKYANREEAQIIVTTKEGTRNIHISIEDNGMGIKPENLPRIFERFYRIETSRNRKAGGSGLGLAIVKHILEGHKQNIAVESVYLSGTKFKFKLEKASFSLTEAPKTNMKIIN